MLNIKGRIKVVGIMKRVVIVLLIAGFFTGCHSGKKKSSKHFSKRSQYSAKIQNTPGAGSSVNSSNVSRINSAGTDETEANQPMTRLDSLLGNTGRGYYSTNQTNFQGASGAGTGSSYASGAYAAAKRKKPKKRRFYNEDELNPDFIQSSNLNITNTNAVPTDSSSTIVSDTTNSADISGW